VVDPICSGEESDNLTNRQPTQGKQFANEVKTSGVLQCSPYLVRGRESKRLTLFIMILILFSEKKRKLKQCTRKPEEENGKRRRKNKTSFSCGFYLVKRRKSTLDLISVRRRKIKLKQRTPNRVEANGNRGEPIQTFSNKLFPSFSSLKLDDRDIWLSLFCKEKKIKTEPTDKQPRGSKLQTRLQNKSGFSRC